MNKQIVRIEGYNVMDFTLVVAEHARSGFDFIDKLECVPTFLGDRYMVSMARGYSELPILTANTTKTVMVTDVPASVIGIEEAPQAPAAATQAPAPAQPDQAQPVADATPQDGSGEPRKRRHFKG